MQRAMSAAPSARPKTPLTRRRKLFSYETSACSCALLASLFTLINPHYFALPIATAALVVFLVIAAMLRKLDQGWLGFVLDHTNIGIVLSLTTAIITVSIAHAPISRAAVFLFITSSVMISASISALRLVPRTWAVNRLDSIALVAPSATGIITWLLCLQAVLLNSDLLRLCTNIMLSATALGTIVFAIRRSRNNTPLRQAPRHAPRPSFATTLSIGATGLIVVLCFTLAPHSQNLLFHMACFAVVLSALGRQAIIGANYSDAVQQLFHREQHYKSLIQNSHDVIALCDYRTQDITYISHGDLWQLNETQELLGTPLHRALGLCKETTQELFDRLRESNTTERIYGTIGDTTLEAVAQDWDGQALVTIRDVTEREHLRSSLHELAFFDSLTKLPNRHHIQDMLGTRIQEAPHTTAVLFIDMDRFKQVNDTAGHEAGDIVLQEAARRLQELTAPEIAVGRIGGDEFIAILDTQISHPKTLAENICQELSTPFSCSNKTYQLGASIGIAMAEPDVAPSELIRRADVAMYSAKHQKLGYTVYGHDLTAAAVAVVRRDATVADALRDERLELHLQPIIELANHTVSSSEALLRWRDKEGNVRSPQPLLSFATRSGQMRSITAWVLDTGLAALATAPRHANLAINIPPHDLLDPEFTNRLSEALTKHQVAPTQLTLEITENELIDQAQRTTAVLDNLNELGVGVMIDDFGAGFSSLAYLVDLPIKGLKIDRKFISALPNRPAARSIVKALCALARENGLVIIAEGVQSPEEAQWVRKLGAPMVQGFYYARPQSADLCGDLTSLTAWHRAQDPRNGHVRLTEQLQLDVRDNSPENHTSGNSLGESPYGRVMRNDP